MSSDNYGLQQQVTGPNISWNETQKGMEYYDEHVVPPRATSAPPHLEAQNWRTTVASGQPSGYGENRALTPVVQDIRLDPAYPAFYEVQARKNNGHMLPPPLPMQEQHASFFNDLNRPRLPGLLYEPNGGLETINEQGGQTLPNVLQAFSQLGLERLSPSPLQQQAREATGMQTPTPSLSEYMAQGEQPLLQLHQQLQIQRLAGSTPPPPTAATPPLPPATPPIPQQGASLGSLGAKALASANLQPVPNLSQMGHAMGVNGNPNDLLGYNLSGYPGAWGTMPYSYPMQVVMPGQAPQGLPVGMGMVPMSSQGPYPHLASQGAFPSPAYASAMVPTQGGLMPVNPLQLPFFPGQTQEINQMAAIAAAAMAMQGMFSGHNMGMRDSHDDKRRDRRSRRDRREMERERERESRHVDQDSLGDGLGKMYTSLEDVKGQVLQVAKDQNGCRFLQRKFDEGGPATISMVFSEVLDNLIALMMDPFGNYLIQKLLDRCSEEQRLQVLQKASENNALVEVALNTHGTRAVQKLIETLTSTEQINLVVESLSGGVVELIRDLNGNHVIQRCLQRLGAERSQFVYDAACGHTMEIATHRHGCCVLQRCIDHATHTQKRQLVAEIAKNALRLSQDPFGNYVVQYVLEQGNPEATEQIVLQLFGHVPELATQKFSSNVVERCIKMGGNDTLNKLRDDVIREIISSPKLSQLLQDPFANYVLQSALVVTHGHLHSQLVDAIKPFLSTLRGTPHGKRILSKINIKL
eukprot:jgi/Botrbrau1/6660/Bobra.0202s0008.1